MHAVCRFMLEFIEILFLFMQTHEKETQLGNYVCVLSPLSCAPEPPRATRVLKQQQHVV